MLIGEKEQRTKIKFRCVDDFETCINAIDVDSDSKRCYFFRIVL